jgi:hypothetical protein
VTGQLSRYAGVISSPADGTPSTKRDGGHYSEKVSQ